MSEGTCLMCLMIVRDPVDCTGCETSFCSVCAK